jgi:hypothetical protein
MPKITISVEYDNTEDAILGLSALRGGDNVAKPVTKETTKPGKSVEKTDSPAATKPDAAKPGGAPEGGTSTAASSGEGGISYDTVTAKIKAAVETHRPQVIETLTAFEAKSGKDLKPKDYAAFLQKLEQATAPAEDLG